MTELLVPSLWSYNRFDFLELWGKKTNSHQEKLRLERGKVDGSDFDRTSSSLPTPVKLRWRLQAMTRSMVYQPLHRDHIKAVTKQRFLEGNNQTSSAPATHHVSANKEVTGVRGEEFQMERLQRCRLHCISWQPERRTNGRKIQRSMVTAISQRGNMKRHRTQAHAHTEHKQQTGSHDHNRAAVLRGG